MISRNFSVPVRHTAPFSESYICAISSALPVIESDLREDTEHRVFCLMGDKKNMVIGRNNKLITSLRWKKRMPDGTPKETRHAEEHAIELCKKKGISPKFAIVMRLLRNGEFTMARPCGSCQRRLRKAGVNKIFYTDWDGGVSSL